MIFSDMSVETTDKRKRSEEIKLLHSNSNALWH